MMQGIGRRLILAMGLVVCMIAPGAWAREVVVVTQDGRRIEGEWVSENDQGVVLSIASVQTSISRNQIKSVEFVETARERYQTKRSKLKDDDLNERYLLAYEMYDAGEYDLAIRELEGLEKVAPKDQRQRFTSLKQAIIESRKQKGQPSTATKDDPKTNQRSDKEKTADTSAPHPSAATKDETLTEDQINIIRIYEIDLSQRPRINVPNEVINKLLTDYADRDQTPKGPRLQQRLRRAPGYEKMKLIFDLQARELYGEVSVQQDPPVLADFRSQVHRAYVVNYCASLKCHGGAETAGDFRLFHDTRNREDYVYTNFYLLHLYQNASGDMINRNDPERSLLLQYGLDRTVAKTPHPDVPGWRAELRNDQTPMYQRIDAWIRSLYRPTPKYPIDYRSSDVETSKPDPAPTSDKTP